MKKSVYIESSIISYLTARLAQDLVSAARQKLTLDWWETSRQSFDALISEVVIQELQRGDPTAAQRRLAAISALTVVRTTREAVDMAKRLIVDRAVPEKSAIDALHIAVASQCGANFLLTWNFKHINNAATRELIARCIQAEGYVCPVLCSPEELLGN